MLEPRTEEAGPPPEVGPPPEEKLLFEWALKRLELEKLRREGRGSSMDLLYLTSETNERFRRWLERAV